MIAVDFDILNLSFCPDGFGITQVNPMPFHLVKRTRKNPPPMVARGFVCYLVIPWNKPTIRAIAAIRGKHRTPTTTNPKAKET